MAKSKAIAPGTLSIPKGKASSDSSISGSPTSMGAQKTPRTPADEGIAFFESEFKKGEPPVRVYELALDPDGGPSKEVEVCPYFPSRLLRVVNSASQSFETNKLVYSPARVCPIPVPPTAGLKDGAKSHNAVHPAHCRVLDP